MNDEEFLKSIMPDLEKYFIQNGRGIIIQSGYEWFREVITLYAKQHNLAEATIVLLDSNMSEEALILSRSLLNNCFLIGYLLNDDDKKSHLKKYHIQPLLSKRFLLKNMKEMLQGPFGKRMKEKGIKSPISINEIKQKKYEIEKEIKNRNFPVGQKMLSILELAKDSDEYGFDLYATYYANASKYEHSDISSLNIYKKSINNEISTNDAFIMDLNRTDEELKNSIYGMLTMCYLDSFIKIINIIETKEPHLKVNYDMKQLAILLNKSLKHINR